MQMDCHVCPVLTSGSQPDDVAHLLTIGQIHSLPVMVEDIQNTTRSARVLSKVRHYAQNGWLGTVPPLAFKFKWDDEVASCREFESSSLPNSNLPF